MMHKIHKHESNSPAHRQLPVEVGSVVTIQPCNCREQIKTTLIGMEPGAFLILKTPHNHSLVKGISPGDHLLLRCIGEGMIYGFRSVCKAKTSRPADMMFVSFPETIERLDIKAKVRYPCGLPAFVKFESGRRKVELVNLSESGCRIALDIRPSDAPRPVAVDDEAGVSFHPPGTDMPMTFDCVVRNVLLDEDSVFVGMEFKPMEKSTAGLLDDYLRLLKETRAPAPVSP